MGLTDDEKGCETGRDNEIGWGRGSGRVGFRGRCVHLWDHHVWDVGVQLCEPLRVDGLCPVVDLPPNHLMREGEGENARKKECESGSEGVKRCGRG